MSDNSLLLLEMAALALPLVFFAASPGKIGRYLQRKRYQYEVTFSLYMLTPTEKFIFNSILFLFVAMVFIAAALYLPTNMANVAGRAWYYLGLDDATLARAGAGTDTLVAEAARASQELVLESARAVMESI